MHTVVADMVKEMQRQNVRQFYGNVDLYIYFYSFA